MSREELREKLSALEEVRKTAKGELEAIRSREERLEALERDKDALLDSYAEMAPPPSTASRPRSATGSTGCSG